MAKLAILVFVAIISSRAFAEPVRIDIIGQTSDTIQTGNSPSRYTDAPFSGYLVYDLASGTPNGAGALDFISNGVLNVGSDQFSWANLTSRAQASSSSFSQSLQITFSPDFGEVFDGQEYVFFTRFVVTITDFSGALFSPVVFEDLRQVSIDYGQADFKSLNIRQDRFAFFSGPVPSFVGREEAQGTITNLIASPVPEPSTYVLLLAGLGVIGFLGRRPGRTI